MALAGLGMLRSYLTRNVVRLLLVASLVPIVISANRGLWVGLGAGLVYAADASAIRLTVVGGRVVYRQGDRGALDEVLGHARERAARLRAAGEDAARQHLEAQVGRVHQVLMESSRMGRTEQFAEVAFEADQPVGAIVEARIRGVTCGQLAA